MTEATQVAAPAATQAISMSEAKARYTASKQAAAYLAAAKLQAGGYASEAAAKSACIRLNSAGISCLAVNR